MVPIDHNGGRRECGSLYSICLLPFCNLSYTLLFTCVECFRMCLHQFKYTGKRQIVGKTGGKPGTTKAMTLPARMQPPDFSGDSPVLPAHSGSSSVGRDGIQQIGNYVLISLCIV